jgi:hypothetical protein
VLVERDPHPIDAAADKVMRALGVKRLRLGVEFADAAGFLADWLVQRQASAALVRPDFYVALVARSPAQLSAQLVELGKHLHLTGTLVAH